MANVCPLNGDNHRYFVFKTTSEFVPVDTDKVVYREDYPGPVVQLYEKVEYAVLGCNCGSVIKTEVKEFQYGEE